MSKKVVIVGAGAAGVFAAIRVKALDPSLTVILLEKSKKPLAKVKISGGGRCNVTHACFDPKELIKNYPRGHLELRGPFTRFQPQDTVHWFEERGVMLKKEKDGRMFPITDSSQTIIDCLLGEVKRLGVELETETAVERFEQTENGFILHLFEKPPLVCHKLLLATGSSRQVFSWLEDKGHKIISPVPSLFTFNIKNFPLIDLAGVSVPTAHVELLESSFEQTGPLLITHWGFSGPSVLKLSAWAARFLHEKSYRAKVAINWLGRVSHDAIKQTLEETKQQFPQKQIVTFCPFELPMRLWKRLIPTTKPYAELSKKECLELVMRLHKDTYDIEGQTTNKEEFVTCGGIACNEVHFKTMESKLIPNLYFAGEILDIDGATGGFNFQNAWTTGWIAAESIAIPA